MNRRPAITPCHRCAVVPEIHGNSYWGNAIVCDRCYDGADDAGPVRNESVDEPTEAKAVAAWNAIQDEAWLEKSTTAIGVQCNHCYVRPGQPCATRRGLRGVGFHARRRVLWRVVETTLGKAAVAA